MTAPFLVHLVSGALISDWVALLLPSTCSTFSITTSFVCFSSMFMEVACNGCSIEVAEYIYGSACSEGHRQEKSLRRPLEEGGRRGTRRPWWEDQSGGALEALDSRR